MPARALAYQQDLRAVVRAHGVGELTQGDGEGRDGDGRQPPPHGAPRGRMHNSIPIAPLSARLDEGLRTAAAAAPDPSQERFESEAMFSHRPQLDPVLWIGGPKRLDHGGQVCLNAA